MAKSWWARATWISAAVAAALAVSAVQNGAQAQGNRVVLAASAIVGVNAVLWVLAAAGLSRQRRWGLHLSAGCAVINLLQGLAAAASSQAAARQLAEQGLVVRDNLVTAALGWAPTLGSAMLLACLVGIHRSVRGAKR